MNINLNYRYKLIFFKKKRKIRFCLTFELKIIRSVFNRLKNEFCI